MGDGLNISSGMGAGEAQVFRPYDVRPYVEQQQNINEQREKEKTGRESKVYSSLSPLDKIDIFYRDQDNFKNKITDVRKYAKENIDALRNGDATATMDFQNLLTDIYNEAALSKNARENFEKIAMDVYKNQDKYDESALDYLNDFVDKKNAGNYQFDVTQILPKVDLFADIKNNVKLNPTETNYEYIDPSTGNKIVSASKKVTPKEADAILETRIMGDPMLYASATKQYERLKKQGKTTDPDVVTWYKNYTRPALVETSTTYKNLPSEWSKASYSFGNGTASSNKYNFVYQPKTDYSTEQISIASTDYSENKPLELYDLNDNTKSVMVTPTNIEIETKKGGGLHYWVVGADEEGNIVKYPWRKIKGKFEANYGIGVDELVNKIKGGGTAKTNPSTGSKETEKKVTKKESEKKQTTKYTKGYIEGGYRFNGGDPTDSKNWTKI